MSLEAFGYITNLNSLNPGGSDPKSQGDDHIRGIKSTLLASFPNINSSVTATPTNINMLTGRTLASSDDVIDNFPAGTKMTFYQAAAPIGWVQDTTRNDAVLRVVSSVGGTYGGTDSIIDLTHTHTQTAHVHTVSSHNHVWYNFAGVGGAEATTGGAQSLTRANSISLPSSDMRRIYSASTDACLIVGTELDTPTETQFKTDTKAANDTSSAVPVIASKSLQVKYIDVIICTKS